MANVLLLRSPSQDQSDRYENAFKPRYCPYSVPVLETVLTNVDELKSILEAGPSEDYGGVIITSGRACEAWRSVVKCLGSGSSTARAGWSAVPFYAVGQATAAALAEIHQNHTASPHAPVNIRGAGSGTSEQLAHFIHTDYDNAPRKLLYLIGDKNKDTLPTILHTSGITLRSLPVYATQRSSGFESDLVGALSLAPKEVNRWWIVLFAPSAAEFVFPILQQHFNLPVQSLADSGSAIRVGRLASIGPTTSTFLRDQLHLHIAVTSPKPTPEALAAAIFAYDDANPD